MLLCCFEPPYDKLCIVCDAVDCWSKLDFELRQRMNIKGGRFVGWHNHEMFSTPPHERDMFYQAVQGVWGKCKSAGALDIAALVVYIVYDG